MRTRLSHPLMALAAISVVVLLGSVAMLAQAQAPVPEVETEALDSPVDPTGFQGTVSGLTAQQRRWMTGESWKPGCPVPMRNLRLLTLTYLDFQGQSLDGRLVVHRSAAADMVRVFEDLYQDNFPLEHLDTTELYPPAQRPEKLRNVTAAFNCRTIKGSHTWSQHAYGLAIDINPVQNPWVNDGKVIPKAGANYVNRANQRQGMISRDGPVVRAFKRIGWGWGGNWSSLKDYMHFSRTGG